MAAFALARGGRIRYDTVVAGPSFIPLFYIDFAMAFMEDGPDVPFILWRWASQVGGGGITAFIELHAEITNR